MQIDEFWEFFTAFFILWVQNRSSCVMFKEGCSKPFLFWLLCLFLCFSVYYTQLLLVFFFYMLNTLCSSHLFYFIIFWESCTKLNNGNSTKPFVAKSCFYIGWKPRICSRWEQPCIIHWINSQPKGKQEILLCIHQVHFMVVGLTLQMLTVENYVFWSIKRSFDTSRHRDYNAFF